MSFPGKEEAGPVVRLVARRRRSVTPVAGAGKGTVCGMGLFCMLENSP